MLQTNHIAAIDFDQGLRRFGSRAIHIRFLLRFMEDKTFDQLQTSVANEDWHQAFCCAHTLKGLSAQLCLMKVSFFSSALCELLRSPECISANDALRQFESLDEAYRQSVAIIRTLG